MKKKRYAIVRIAPNLLPRLDEIARKLGYKRRDEVVNDAVRRFIELIDSGQSE